MTPLIMLEPLSFIILIGLIPLALFAIFLTEIEQFGWATFLMLVCIGLAQAFNVVSVLSFVREHAMLTLCYALAYAGAGVVWSFFKWFSFLHAYRDDFREAKEKFCASQDPPLDKSVELSGDMLRAFQGKAHLPRGFGDDLWQGHRFEKPRASKNKARIISWMCLWPLSVIGTIFNDPVRRLFNFLFTRMKALYERMSDHVFRDDRELK